MTLCALSRSWSVRDFVFTPTFSTETGHGFLDALTWKLTFPDPRTPHHAHRVSFHLASPTAENQCENSELDNSRN